MRRQEAWAQILDLGGDFEKKSPNRRYTGLSFERWFTTFRRIVRNLESPLHAVMYKTSGKSPFYKVIGSKGVIFGLFREIRSVDDLMIIIILKNGFFLVCIFTVNGVNQKCSFTE